MEETLKKITFALLKGTVSTKTMKESIRHITMFYMTYNCQIPTAKARGLPCNDIRETIKTLPLIMPHIRLKNGLTQKQIEPILKKYIPNHAVFHFIEFLEKYGIKEKYLKNVHITENNLMLTLINKPAVHFLDSLFNWKYTTEGYAYWEMMCNRWIKHINKLQQRYSNIYRIRDIVGPF